MMIKIKSDLNLEELEKFGFVKYEKSNCYSRCYGILFGNIKRTKRK